jgi:hypothetical protein
LLVARYADGARLAALPAITDCRDTLSRAIGATRPGSGGVFAFQ